VAKEGDAAEQGDGSDVSTKHNALQVISTQSLATEVKVGMRMPSFKVLNQADARPSHFQELLKSNGRWRVVIFAGDVSQSQQLDKIVKLGQNLSSSDSFLKRFTPAGERYDSVFELLTVHAAPRTKTTIFDFPEVFRPYDATDGWDYWKIFVDDQSYHEGHGQIYQSYGIDRSQGCAVILRPDQYVSYVGAVDDYQAMENFFSSFMIPQDQWGRSTKKMLVNGQVNGCFGHNGNGTC
jgi:phenol 2-monooxygenase (NADPH)